MSDEPGGRHAGPPTPYVTAANLVMAACALILTASRTWPAAPAAAAVLGAGHGGAVLVTPIRSVR